ncbi:hypothetical protein [Chryseobacterium indoltheticum]|uniref:hypothetical protein n=1 Tax=Chryseobacterium indoltheticum TaxID=254 RepID=UPI003F4994D4
MVKTSFYLGNENLLVSHEIQIPENLKLKAKEIQSKAHTLSYIAQENETLGFVSFSDKIKESSRKSCSTFNE